jgi:aerobic C4-dicarboxylate transport protein
MTFSLRRLGSPFVQVLCAIALGIVLGVADPALAVRMKPLGDLFVSLIRLLIGPIVFFTLASGMPAMGGIRQVGRVGIKALVYFELMSALALLAGLAGAWLLQPGAGFRLDGAPSSSAVPHQAQSLGAMLMQALAASRILQVPLLAIACGLVLALLGARGRRLAEGCGRIAGWLFMLVRLLMKAAPLAAFGAIAWTVGRHGLFAVTPLLKLVGALYLATIVFVMLVLGAVARAAGFRILGLIRYLKEDLMLVFGTSSSVTVMPALIDKMERAGCPASLAAIVVPAGYSFNLNGSNIYIALALVFLAQALGVELDAGRYLAIVAVAMVTSKSASGVAGSAFVALAATLAAVPAIPDASLAFIVGIERLLKCRPLANVIGNGVACLAIAAWEKTLDRDRLQACRLD